MKPIRNIMVPVDFSELSTAAQRMAVDLAKRFDAKITLVHVYGIPAYSFPEGFIMPNEVLARIAEGAQNAIERVRSELAATGVEVIALTSAGGSPADEIVARAQSHEADMIVMGTHGRTGLKHALLGSVAERVVRMAPCPVLTVRR